MKPRSYRMNCYFYKSLLILTIRHYSQSLDIIRKVFDISFFRARKCFLLIINALCVIAIIIIIIFKILSKHLYLNNALERSDLYYYRNLSVIWNDSKGFAIVTCISKHFFQSKHYFHIYSPIFNCLIFDVHVMIIKFYFQNIVF